jgi:ectoine hydroxylase-related dioxygenase (phytanoyl-CoA dioxygenase family)
LQRIEMPVPFGTHPDAITLAVPRGSVLIWNTPVIPGGSTDRNSAPRHAMQVQYLAAGDRMTYKWADLPDEIKRDLKPKTRRLLGLGTQ